MIFPNVNAVKCLADIGHRQLADILRVFLPVVSFLKSWVNDGDLYAAIGYKRVDLIRFLLDHGASAGLGLFIAASRGHESIARLITEHWNVEKEYLQQALECAVDGGNISIMKLMIDNGANIHVDDDWLLCEAAARHHYHIVTFLVEEGADIHTGDDFPLFQAVYFGCEDVVRFLIERGANIHARGERALNIATENGHESIVKYLVEKGANVNHGSLVSAAKEGSCDIVSLLVDNGADLVAYGEEALWNACRYGHDMVVEYLLAKGVRSKAAKFIAKEYQHKHIVSLFE